MMDLSPGKFRALTTLANAHGVFTILALDHDVSFRQQFWGEEWQNVPYEVVVATKLEMAQILAPHASGILLDPPYGLGPAIATGAVPGTVGLMAPVEDEATYATAPQPDVAFRKGWSVAQAKRLGVAGIKFYYPYAQGDSANVARLEGLVQQLVAECNEHDLPLFAEPIHYLVEGAERRGSVIAAARRMSELGADVLKLEFPADVNESSDDTVWSAACAELTAAMPRPWILLSAGVDYATYKRQLECACAAGASGYAAGRAVWSEAAELEGAARSEWLRTVAVARLNELTAIANAHAKPWRSWYGVALPEQDWFASYGS